MVRILSSLPRKPQAIHFCRHLTYSAGWTQAMLTSIHGPLERASNCRTFREACGVCIEFQQSFSIPSPPGSSPGDSDLYLSVLISLKGAGQAMEEESETIMTIQMSTYFWESQHKAATKSGISPCWQSPTPFCFHIGWAVLRQERERGLRLSWQVAAPHTPPLQVAFSRPSTLLFAQPLYFFRGCPLVCCKIFLSWHFTVSWERQFSLQECTQNGKHFVWVSFSLWFA